MVANRELMAHLTDRLTKAVRNTQEVLLRETMAQAQQPAINLNFPEGVIRLDEGRVVEVMNAVITEKLAESLRVELNGFAEAVLKQFSLQHGQVLDALNAKLVEALANAPQPQVTVQPPAVNIAPQIDMEKLLQTIQHTVTATMQECFRQQRVGMKTISYHTQAGERKTITVEAH